MDKMSTGVESEQLTDEQIRCLAKVVSASDMEFIAYLYLELEYKTVVSCQRMAERDPEAFNSEIIKQWRNRNPDNFRQVSRFILNSWHIMWPKQNVPGDLK